MKYAPHLEARIRAQEQFRQQGECDPDYLNKIAYITGRYESECLVAGDYVRQDILGTDLYLAGMEVRLADRIDELLAARENGLDVALDIGGGVGVTWLKLAVKYRKEIRDGRLILAVTNYAKGPVDHLQWLAGQRGRTKQAARAAALYERCKEGVQYIDYFNFSASMDSSVRLKDGRWISAVGHVGLMHERFSLTAWGCVPEEDIPRAARHLSPRGAYFVPVEDKAHYQYMLSPAEQRGREQGNTIAHDALTDSLGLQRVTHVEDGSWAGAAMNYLVFRGPNSQPVAVG